MKLYCFPVLFPYLKRVVGKHIIYFVLLLAALPSHAQIDIGIIPGAEKLVERVAESIPDLSAQIDAQAEQAQTITQEEEVPLEELYSETLMQDESGLVLEAAPVNEILQYLSKQIGKQYFHNSNLAGPQYEITGHLNFGDSRKQIDDIAFMYGIKIHEQGNTIYAMTDAQARQLSRKEWHYQLRYLRPSDIEQVKNLLRPLLSDASSGRSVVNYETKTNTLIVMDREENIARVQAFLEKIDRPKGQVVIEVKILRVNRSSGKSVGVDWSRAFGEAGIPFAAAGSLSRLFNLSGDVTRPSTSNVADTIGGLTTTFNESSGGSFVLSPLQISGVLRALRTNDLSQEISSPTVITEDNEPAAISIIDRFPIITRTVSNTAAGANISEEVRYSVDEGDPTLTDGADQTREIGITVSVTPTSLPDGTIRMKLRPRSSQITGFVQGENNQYPRVTESMIEAIARVPDGHSLLVGGFYGTSLTDDKNEVPWLSRIPGLRLLFKNENTQDEKTSLIFIVTPRKYEPSNITEQAQSYHRAYENLGGEVNYASSPQDGQVAPQIPHDAQSSYQPLSSQDKEVLDWGQRAEAIEQPSSPERSTRKKRKKSFSSRHKR